MKNLKENNVVMVEALDLTTFDGEAATNEDLLPVVVYGRVISVDKIKVCIATMESADGEHGESNFDQRIYIPLGCIVEVTHLRK